jgi:F-type H+-transporting ATPase subunit b
MALIKLIKLFTDAPLTEEDFISKIIPNFWSFLTQFLALVVLLVVVLFVAYKPVSKMLKKRQDYIESNIKEAEKSKAKAIALEREAKEKILLTHKEANAILEKASLDAEEARNIAIINTNKEIEAMKIRAEEDIKKAKLDAREEIKKEIISVALDSASLILKREVNSEDNSKLVEQFIEDNKK